VKEFFTQTASEIHSHAEDGNFLQVFTPVLDVIKSKFQNQLTLMHPEVNRYIDLLMFFTNSAPLAEVCNPGHNYSYTDSNILLCPPFEEVGVNALLSPTWTTP
jgi:hypothetical protein